MKAKIIPILFMLLATAVLSACGGQTNPEEAASSVPAVAAAEANMLTFEGKVVPANYIDLSFQLPGRVTDIFVVEGETVTAGTPLIQLDNRDQQLNLKRAEGMLAQAEIGVETAEAGLASAEAALEIARVGVQSAEAQLALLQADPTAEQLALNQTQVGLSEAAVSQASGQLTLTVEGAGSGQIASAQAQLEAARAELVPLEIRQSQANWGDIELSNEEINQLNLQMAAARAKISAAQTALAEAKAGATSAERAAASSAVSAANASLEASEAQQALFLAGTREEQLELSRIALGQAQSAVVEAELQVALSQENVAQAKAQAAEAAEGVALAELALEKMVLTATIDGTVASITPHVGEVVLASRPVIAVANLEQWHIETSDLTELEVIDVVLGSTVDVLLDAYPDSRLTGEVIEIASNSTISLGDVTYVVTVELENPADINLHWGLTSLIELDL